MTKLYSTEAERWNAVVARNADADSHFFYGVISTGVYCYPSCPSKLALRENTRFYTTRAEVCGDGFRACKRCLSDQPPLEARQQGLVTDACRLIEDTSQSLSVADVAKRLGISRFYLTKLCKHYLGISPKAYEVAVRSNRVEQNLKQSKTVTQAIYQSGFSHASSFYKTSQIRNGLSATARRKGGNGYVMHYVFGKSSLGSIIVAATDQGICAVLFGDNEAALLKDLGERFSKAKLHQGSDKLQAWISVVLAFIEHPQSGCTLPLDIQGTAFQQKVWQALRQIPVGETASYAEIASVINQPKAARAVARACAANPLAVVVPCHRVVKSDGSLSGYRWGKERKQALLNREIAELDKKD